MIFFLEYLVKFIFKYSLIIILPFVTLTKGSVYFYLVLKYSTWSAILLAFAISTLLLTIYLAYISYKASKKFRLWIAFSRVVLPLTFFYCCLALYHFSNFHAKSEKIKSYYTSLHPIIRISICTITLIDKTILITDIQRKPQDYKKMGLKINKNSLHYKQNDNHVHAIDLRTKGRTPLRNLLIKSYFDFLGFSTLRHEGLGDHLHVSLPIQEN